MIDLHLHTQHSDGRLSPRAMIREAAARSLSAVAVTDHDVLTGLPEAIDEGLALGVEVIPGIEMTCSGEDGHAVHVLGYFLEVTNVRLSSALEQARSQMAAHVDGVLDAVRAVGGHLDASHLQRYRTRYAGGAALVLGMIEQGVLRGSTPGTGWRLLKMAAAEPRGYSVREAVDLIHAAGGVASLAHPARLRRRSPLLGTKELLSFAELGFDAIEAWQWIPNGWGSDHYRGVARELGLLVSGGSDDHGKRLSDGRMRLGAQVVPECVLEGLRDCARRWRRAIETTPHECTNGGRDPGAQGQVERAPGSTT